MTMEPGAPDAPYVQALYESFRRAKDDLRGVDTAAARRLTTRGYAWKDGAASLTEATWWLIGGKTAALLACNTADAMVGAPDTTITVASAWTAGAYAAYGSWRRTGKHNARIQRDTERLEEFLFAGVALELELGDLRRRLTAFDGAHESAEEVATQAYDCWDAFAAYVAALDRVHEIDDEMRMPWSRDRLDAALTGELLAAELEGYLARAESVARNPLGPTGTVDTLIPPSPRGAHHLAVGARHVGDLDEILAATDVLRKGLEKVGHVLRHVETDLTQATREAATTTSQDALNHASRLIAEASLCQVAVETDCVVIETAAQQAKGANGSKACDHLALASTERLRTGFERLQASMTTAARQLTATPNEPALSRAANAVGDASTKIPQLAATAGTLATTFDQTLADLRLAIAS